VAKFAPWLALGIGAYLVFALASFPAAAAYRWFAPEVVRLAGVEGTLWSGRAAGGSVAGLGVRDVHWRLRPLSLLLGRVAAAVDCRLADGFVSTDVSASKHRVQLGDLKASTSLQALAPVLPTRGMRGLANLTVSSLSLEDGWPTAMAGELKLAQLQVAPLVASGGAAQLLPLGDYAVDLGTGPHGEIAANFKDTGGGPLEVSGTLLLDAMRMYMLDAFVKPRADAPQPLVQGLAFMTPDPDASGRRHLTLTGSL